MRRRRDREENDPLMTWTHDRIAAEARCSHLSSPDAVWRYTTGALRLSGSLSLRVSVLLPACSGSSTPTE